LETTLVIQSQEEKSLYSIDIPKAMDNCLLYIWVYNNIPKAMDELDSLISL